MSGAYVVVGIDGSDESLEAARFAAAEARMRHLPLRIVHAATWPYVDGPADAPLAAREDARVAWHKTEALMDDALRFVESSAPDVVASTAIVPGVPNAALADAAVGAAVLVVGRRRGAIAKLRSTSVVAGVVAHAPCPVIVVQGVSEPRTNVLVGVGTSRSTQAALAVAFQEADLRSTGVTAIHAWRTPALASRGVAGGVTLAGEIENNADAARVLSEALAGWLTNYPDMVVRRAVPEGSAIDALVQASTYAQMLVIGVPDRRRVQASIITHELIRRAMCPVLIVPVDAVDVGEPVEREERAS